MTKVQDKNEVESKNPSFDQEILVLKSERRLPIVSDVLANYKVGKKNADLWLTRDSRAMCQTIITRNKSDNGLK